ncbi:MAG: helix-turn-helix domain-containing protein [Thermoplasmata archaeon]
MKPAGLDDELDIPRLSEQIVSSAIHSDKAFRETLEKTISRLGMNVTEFSKISKIPKSTIYKLLCGEREPNIRTLRLIVNAIKKSEGKTKENFIAVIVAREVINQILERKVRIGNKTLKVREYPARTFEDAIVSAVRAERDGALGVVCAPIIAPTIERILRIPITTIMPKKCIEDAIKKAARKAV